jgi:Heparinase II/III-like protein/Heparinase II/III N-terminus
MSPEEIAWRLRSTLRDVLDRGRMTIGYPSSPAVAPLAGEDSAPGFTVCDAPVGAWNSPAAADDEVGWRQRLLDQADRIALHRLSFFDLKDVDLGHPPDWNRDHGSGKAAPMGFAPAINYRDYHVTGDAKVVWEPNRHHQLVVLGRAYRAGGDRRYAFAVVEMIESWLRQCPFGRGMNWRSPLELAVRLVNWVWVIDLIRDSGLFTGAFRSRVLRAVHLHLWEISRKYSRGSSANNHIIGEAAGVYIASTYFRELADTSRWREQSRQTLCREIEAQTYADGCNREQALGYHAFVLEFFLLAGIVARRAGEPFPDVYWSRLEGMLEFVGMLREGGTPPMFGDADDGYVLDLGGKRGDVAGLLAIGAVLYRRSDFKTWAGGYPEPAWWLLGPTGRARYAALPPPSEEEQLASRSFPDAGYFLLQCGRRGADDRVSVLFDCGELWFGSLAAHGHADALSFTLRAFGVDVLVDPGTYDYFSYPAWRDYFRSTRAHNTLVVDGTDQSTMEGPFLWGRRAKARGLEWAPGTQGGRVSGEHDGYTRLADPVMHRRILELDGRSRVLTIRDEIRARGRHEVAVYFHLSEICRIAGAESNRYRIAVGRKAVTLVVDSRLSVETLTGSEDPIGGWVSRGYHQKAAATTLVARGHSRGDATFDCRVELDPAS